MPARGRYGSRHSARWVPGRVIADHARHVGIDRLVVGDAGPDGIGERQVPRPIGPHQTRHTQHAIGQEGLGIEIIVLDPPIDHVDSRKGPGGSHKHASSSTKRSRPSTSGTPISRARKTCSK